MTPTTAVPLNGRCFNLEGEGRLRKPNVVMTAVVAASFAVSSCISAQWMPLPEPEIRPELNVRGVVLGNETNARTVEFSEVYDTRWTETHLVLTGALHAPGQPDHGQTTTMSFPLADVSELLVRQLDGTRSSLIVAGTIMSASILISFLVTGQSVDGVPIGTDQ